MRVDVSDWDRWLFWAAGLVVMVLVVLREAVLARRQGVAADPAAPSAGAPGAAPRDYMIVEALRRVRAATGPAAGPSPPRLGGLERAVTWLVAYPLFPLEVALFVAVSWLGFGSGLGLPDLLWYEGFGGQAANGFAVTLLFADVLTVRYLLDRRPGAAFAPAEADSDGLWSPGSRAFNRYLIPSLVALLALLVGPKLVAFVSPEWVGWGHVRGHAGLPVGAAVALFWAVVASSVFDRAKPNAFQRMVIAVASRLPGFRRGEIPEAELALHARAGRMIVVPFVVLVGIGLASRCGAVTSPVVIVCVGLAIFNAVYGVVAFHFAGLQYVFAALAAAIGVVCNTGERTKMTFPGLEDYYDGPAVKLDELPPADPAVPRSNLVKTEKMLPNFAAKWRGPGKPKLVIVASSGGGIRAAAWTAVVLRGLEHDETLSKARFRDHIRLMTGASGGMVAAGLYAAEFDRPDAVKTLPERMAMDSLWPTAQTMFLRDLPWLGLPLDNRGDRGRSLEDRWVDNARHSPPPAAGTEGLGFESTFADLNAGGAEEKCRRPSLVFSPMLVEDCRRLLITNLDLTDMTTVRSSTLNRPYPGFDPDALSVPVIDFWRAFPEAYPKFRLKTAARMSATFPFVGPAVGLPTDPPRRVVDAGYFDNFGVNLAAVWLSRNRELIRLHTSGVVVVEIRAYPRRAEKLFTDPVNAPDPAVKRDAKEAKREKEKRQELFSWALSEASAPAEAILNLYSRGAYFRNDLQLELLDGVFNGERPARAARAASAGGWTAGVPPFFTTVTFECQEEAKLSWTLPRRDFVKITDSFARPEPQAALKALADWFGTGGK